MGVRRSTRWSSRRRAMIDGPVRPYSLQPVPPNATPIACALTAVERPRRVPPSTKDLVGLPAHGFLPQFADAPGTLAPVQRRHRPGVPSLRDLAGLAELVAVRVVRPGADHRDGPAAEA